MHGSITFDGAPPEGTVNLGIGQPSADLLPLDLLRQASESFFRNAVPLDLNYGVPKGDVLFLDSLAGFLGEEYGAEVRPESLVVTGGCSQALDLITTVFTKPGDTVFVEEPSYHLAFQIFRDHELRLVGVPVDEDGMRIDVLPELLNHYHPAFIYIIPSYQNPTGRCMKRERRTQLIELSQRYGFLIAADEVYQLLHYVDDPPEAFGTMIGSDTVLSLGSFSKILAPGLRLGWIQAGSGLRQRLLRNGFLNSGGSVNRYSSLMVRHAIDLGLQQTHVMQLRTAYEGRVRAMQASLETHFSDLATWQPPDGGYFFWLRLPDDLNAAAFTERAREMKTGFQPGWHFSCEGRLENFIRLSFAHYGENQILQGVERLRDVFA